jgi:hypothetical protein
VSGKRESRRFQFPEHSQEQALTSLVSIQKVIPQVFRYDLRIKTDLEQFSSLYSRPIGNGYMTSKGRRLAERVALGNVELNGHRGALELREERCGIRLPTGAGHLYNAQNNRPSLLPGM